MDVGQLDRRVLIEAPTEARDAFGALTPSWSTVCTVWCSVQPIAGAERLALGAAVASAHFRVIIRYRSDVTPKCRVTLSGGRVAVVHSVTEQGRKDMLELICEQTV